jgi:hypothetical protein
LAPNHQDRRANVAMMAFLDDIIGNVTTALQTKEMWNNTLLIWSSGECGGV